MKILALYGPEEFSRYYDADVYPIYREVKGWEKKLFKLYEHTHIGNISTWLEAWKDKVEQYDLIFIVDGIRGRDVLEYIRKRNKHARIIIYYVNPIDVSDRKAPANYEGFGCEFYSFDPQDARNFNIKYKHWYYAEDQQRELYDKKIDIQQDIFFCGVDKGRLPYLKELKEQFAFLGLKSKMLVVKSSDISYSGNDREWLSQPISYDEMIDNIVVSKAILDVVQPGQRGITLRPMEAMFYDRKLITNNPDVKQYDFYNPHNIFILQERSMAELSAFLQAPIEVVPEEIKGQYQFCTWVKEFLREN